MRRERKPVCVETLKPLTTKDFQSFKECKLVGERRLVDGGVHLLVGVQDPCKKWAFAHQSHGWVFFVVVTLVIVSPAASRCLLCQTSHRRSCGCEDDG